jgi:hypothetical protein
MSMEQAVGGESRGCEEVGNDTLMAPMAPGGW